MSIETIDPFFGHIVECIFIGMRWKISFIRMRRRVLFSIITPNFGKGQEAINLSEAEKLRQINEAEGRAEEIRLIAEATAAGVRAVGAAVSEPGGKDAINLRVAEQWVTEFGKLAKANNTMIVPAQLGDVSTLVSTVMGTMGNIQKSD